jgi:hypothetical protein
MPQIVIIIFILSISFLTFSLCKISARADKNAENINVRNKVDEPIVPSEITLAKAGTDFLENKKDVQN